MATKPILFALVSVLSLNVTFAFAKKDFHYKVLKNKSSVVKDNPDADNCAYGPLCIVFHQSPGSSSQNPPSYYGQVIANGNKLNPMATGFGCFLSDGGSTSMDKGDLDKALLAPKISGVQSGANNWKIYSCKSKQCSSPTLLGTYSFSINKQSDGTYTVTHDGKTSTARSIVPIDVTFKVDSSYSVCQPLASK